MKKMCFFLIALLFAAANINAQTFDESTYSSNTENDDIFAVKVKQSENTKQSVEQKKEIQILKADENPKEFFMPDEKQNAAIEKEVERGNARIQRVYKKGEEPNPEEEQVIFLYMDNFKMVRLGSYKTNCSMRFLILTNLDQPLTSFDARLTWADMKTSVSFSNIIPNKATYVDYTLMGEGCYTMDKVPNIEVNRCRVKGLSQEQCSNKIRWVE